MSLSWARATFNAVMDPGAAARQAASGRGSGTHRWLDVAVLHAAVEATTVALLSADYDRLSRSLPDLIALVELAGFEASGGQQVDVARLRSDVYALAGWTLIKADDPLTAWIAAQRGLGIAEQVDDVLRVAAATRCVSEVYMRAGQFAEAFRTALLATTHLDAARASDRPAALCLRGAALLSAAAAAARGGEEREARAALRAASAHAGRLRGDHIHLDTMFGPTNVAIHQVAVAVELGDSARAAQYIPSVNVKAIPARLAERRARFLIDVARTYAGLHDASAAEHALTEAESIAADEVRSHRLTHDLLRDLMSQERRTSGLRSLASRCGLRR